MFYQNTNKYKELPRQSPNLTWNSNSRPDLTAKAALKASQLTCPGRWKRSSHGLAMEKYQSQTRQGAVPSEPFEVESGKAKSQTGQYGWWPLMVGRAGGGQQLGNSDGKDY